MAINKITCIQLDGEFPDFCYRLVMPDYGLPLIGTILAQAGYDVKVYIEHIKPPEWDRIKESDLVCFSAINAAAAKTYRLAREIKSKIGVPIIIGGTHATYYPESCLDSCDYVVLGEGDETIVELVRTLSEGGDVTNVAGISYRAGREVRRTAPRVGPDRFDTVPDFSLISGYPRLRGLDILLQRRRPLLTMQSSRGCQYNCTFCIVNTMFPGGYRKRAIDSVIRDMRDKSQYGRAMMFVDNEFAVIPRYTKKLLRRMIQEKFDFEIVVFARVEVVKDDELLSLMREAGITHIYQGYESVQPETLVAYKKRQKYEQIVAAIEKLHSFGFGILSSFVLGADTDTVETIRRTADFIIERKLANAYMFPIWGHFPEESNGFQTIIPWYRSIFKGWGYCDGHYATHFPAQMPPSVFQRELIAAYRKIYSTQEILRALVDGRYAVAKGRLMSKYAWGFVEKNLWEYVTFLEEIEEGLYDAEGKLREDLLVQRVEKDPRWTFQAGNRTLEALGISPLELPIPVKRNITCVSPRLGTVTGPS